MKQGRARPEAMQKLKEEICGKYGTVTNLEKIMSMRKGGMAPYLHNNKIMGPARALAVSNALGITLSEFRHRYYAPETVSLNLADLIKILYDNFNGRDIEKTTVDHIQALSFVANVLVDLDYSPDQIPVNTLFHAQILRFMREIERNNGHGKIEGESAT